MSILVAAVWGKEGSGKSSMALTWPRPIRHYDIDVGGYDRAIWRMKEEGITSTSYPIPIQEEKLLGAKTEGVSFRFPRRIVGYKELWQKIVTDYIKDCKDTAVKTIIMDSATQLWTICHQSMLQEKQEIQIANKISVEDPKFREKLQPVEYPNDRMRSLIYAARSYKKNLVLTHYPRNVYKERFDSSGKLVSFKSEDLEPDGFRDTTKLVDIVFWTYVDANTAARAKISIKCGVPGLGMTAVGLELASPTYEGLLQLIKAQKGE